MNWQYSRVWSLISPHLPPLCLRKLCLTWALSSLRLVSSYSLHVVPLENMPHSGSVITKHPFVIFFIGFALCKYILLGFNLSHDPSSCHHFPLLRLENLRLSWLLSQDRPWGHIFSRLRLQKIRPKCILSFPYLSRLSFSLAQSTLWLVQNISRSVFGNMLFTS